MKPTVTFSWILLGLLMCLFWLLSFNTVFQADDFTFFVGGGHAAIHRIKHIALHLNPRIGEAVLGVICSIPDSAFLYRLLNPLFFLIIGYSMAVIVADRRRISRAHFWYLVVFGVMMLFLFGGSRAYNQFWMAGGCNWFWPMGGIVYMMALLARGIRGESFGLIDYLMLAFCSAVAGSSTETQVVSLILILPLLALAYLRKDNWKLFFVACVPFVVSAGIFFSLIIFSITLDWRYGGYGHESFGQLSLIQKYLQPVPWEFLLHDIAPLFIIMLLLCAGVMLARRRQSCSITSGRWLRPVLLGAAAFVCSLLPLPLAKNWMADKTLLFPSIILLTGCMWGISACLLVYPRTIKIACAVLFLCLIGGVYGCYLDMKCQQRWWTAVQDLVAKESRDVDSLVAADPETKKVVTLPGMWQFMKKDVRFPGADFICYSHTAYRLHTRSREYSSPTMAFNLSMQRYLNLDFHVRFDPIPKKWED